jgi:hypothetical protein
MQQIKVRAASEDRRLKDLMADLLRRGLADEERNAASKAGHRVELPLIKGHPAQPGQELTPQRVAEILMDEEAESYLRP